MEQIFRSDHDMMRKEILLFDLDDTLLYTFKTGYQRVLYSLNQMKLPSFSLEEFKTVYGRIPFYECIPHWVGTERSEEFIHYYEESKRFNSYEAIYSDSFFEDLLNLSFKLGIVTNTPVEKFENKLKEVNMDSTIFDFVLCNANKPDPAGIIRAVDFFEAEKEKVVYIGDSLVDYEAAIAAKVDFLAVTSGVTSKELFLNRGLDSGSIFSTIEEIPDILFQTQ